MAAIDKFDVKLVRGETQKCVGIMYEDWVILDFDDGRLWRWGSLPKGIDIIDGKMIIEGMDDITGDK